MSETEIPKGYWKDGRGNLVPVGKIKDIDKARDKVVRELCAQALKQSADLFAFKTLAMQAVNDFVETSLAQYDAKVGGAKGNVTLYAFDESLKIVRTMQDTLAFDERLQAAKALIDECIMGWSKGSNANIKVLVNDAFQVDTAGRISTSRVLGLKRHKIEDDTWKRAMLAIQDSTRVSKTKPYIRFYMRDEDTGDYSPINLDVAAA